jgi:tetratricopeptide (TPR) repeat protein
MKLFIAVVVVLSGCTDSPVDNVEKGRSAIERKDYNAAIAHLTQAIADDPRNEEAYYSRAFAYFSKKEYDKAIIDYTEAIRLNPRSKWAYNDRGNCHKDKKAFRRAIESRSSWMVRSQSFTTTAPSCTES